MKTKLLFTFLAAVTISNSAFADSAKMNVGVFDGQLFTNENLRIESVKFEAGFNFCAGFCALGINTKVTPIKTRLQASPNRKVVNFQSLESPSLRGRSFFQNFRFCGVQVTVTGAGDDGQKFSATSLMVSSEYKGDCARGGATPSVPNPIELKSYMGNGNHRVYYIAQ